MHLFGISLQLALIFWLLLINYKFGDLFLHHFTWGVSSYFYDGVKNELNILNDPVSMSHRTLIIWVHIGSNKPLFINRVRDSNLMFIYAKIHR